MKRRGFLQVLLGAPVAAVAASRMKDAPEVLAESEPVVGAVEAAWEGDVYNCCTVSVASHYTFRAKKWPTT